MVHGSSRGTECWAVWQQCDGLSRRVRHNRRSCLRAGTRLGNPIHKTSARPPAAVSSTAATARQQLGTLGDPADQLTPVETKMTKKALRLMPRRLLYLRGSIVPSQSGI